MKKHTSVISGELPDYLQGQYEWIKPQRPLHTPAKGLRAVLNQVSAEAPPSFLLRHVQPSSPEARKAVFRSEKGDAKDLRLMQDLRSAGCSEFTKFNYEDSSPEEGKPTDLCSLPWTLGIDITKNKSDGLRAKLPFYQAYAVAARKRQFPKKNGLFVHMADQKSIERTNEITMRMLRTGSRGRTRLKLDASGEEGEIVQGDIAASSLIPKPGTPSLKRRPSLFANKHMRALLTPSSSRHDCKPLTPASHHDSETRSAIEAFDSHPPSLHYPVTKASLGL
jgi:hypothetical protein